MRNITFFAILASIAVLPSCGSNRLLRLDRNEYGGSCHNPSGLREYDMRFNGLFANFGQTDWRQQHQEQKGRYGIRTVYRKAYIPALTYGRTVEITPVGVGSIYREYTDSPGAFYEYSVELHHGTHTYQTSGIRRTVQTDTIRFVFSPVYRLACGLFIGAGAGGRIGYLQAKDVDYYWMPPEIYHYRRFILSGFGQAKMGYDSGLGFYIEGAATLEIGAPFTVGVGWELSVGFYF